MALECDLALIVAGNMLVRPANNDEIRRAYSHKGLNGAVLPGMQPRSWIALAHSVARYEFAGTGLLTPLQPQNEDSDEPGFGDPLNGVQSFAVLPCGSKGNREEAEQHEAAMGRLLDWIRLQEYAPGEGNPLWCAMVQFGTEDGGRRARLAGDQDG